MPWKKGCIPCWIGCHQRGRSMMQPLLCFHPTTGACPNKWLWFKTTLKYGQLCFDSNQLAKLQVVLRDLSKLGSSGSHQMEIYALEMQLTTHQKDLKQVRKTFENAMAVRGGIPRTLALFQELGCWVYGLLDHYFLLEYIGSLRSRNKVEQITRRVRRSWCNILIQSMFGAFCPPDGP